MVAKAKTGSGKTFAYLLPLLHELLKLSSEGRIRKPAPNAFILVPTRELCQQVVNLSLLFCEYSMTKFGYNSFLMLAVVVMVCISLGYIRIHMNCMLFNGKVSLVLGL